MRTTLVLASASPRRARLLEGAGLTFEVRPADVDESPADGEPPIDYVRRIARAKASAVVEPGVVVVAADTTVEMDGEIFAKPVDTDDARRMLGRLSGTTHLVHTAVVVAAAGVEGVEGVEGADGVGRVERVEVVTTEVDVVPLTREAIEWYVSTGEPMDKAGAYAIQGKAAGFVAGVRGSVTNVVGLPLAETLALLGAVDALDRR